MARGITQQDVDRAADALLAGGERPTVERIRQHLGTGSPNTVTRLLDVWWRELGGRLAAAHARMALPEAPEAVVALAAQLWEQALASARELEAAALEPEREALAAARQEAEDRVSKAMRDADAAQAAQARAVGALTALRGQFEDRQRLIDQQAEQIADLTRQRDELRGQTLELGVEANTLRERLDAAQSAYEAARAEAAAHLRAFEDRAHAEVDRARQDAQALRRQLQAAEKTAATKHRALEERLAEAASVHAAVTRELAVEKARSQTLHEQLRQLQDRVGAALEPKPTAKPRLPRRRAPARSRKSE
jgi:chromosome segregation ATPase